MEIQELKKKKGTEIGPIKRTGLCGILHDDWPDPPNGKPPRTAGD